jgi:hypothetical protein
VATTALMSAAVGLWEAAQSKEGTERRRLGDASLLVSASSETVLDTTRTHYASARQVVRVTAFGTGRQESVVEV